jgi:hypothetical protein
VRHFILAAENNSTMMIKNIEKQRENGNLHPKKRDCREGDDV